MLMFDLYELIITSDENSFTTIVAYLDASPTSAPPPAPYPLVVPVSTQLDHRLTISRSREHWILGIYEKKLQSLQVI